MQHCTVSAEELALYRQDIRRAVREDGVVCLECGALSWRLGGHVRVHGLYFAAYRAKWGYPAEARLVLSVPAHLRRRPLTPRPPARGVSRQEIEHYGDDIREAVWEDGIVCLECGGVYRSLGSHVRAHEIT